MGRDGRTRVASAFVPLAFVTVSVTSCSASCKAYAAFDFAVTVLTASGERVCDATVMARDGDFTAVLDRFGEGQGCTYSGVVAERPGTYSLEVSTRSQSKTIPVVKVSADQCHVIGRNITVTLDH